MPTTIEMKEYVNNMPGFIKHNGLRLTVLDTDYCEVEMDITENSLNPAGYLHGGVYYTMADCAAGMAAHTNNGDYVTLNGSMNYLKPISGGKIKAIANVLHRGRTTCVCRARVVDEKGALLSEGTYTMYCVAQPEEGFWDKDIECGDIKLNDYIVS